MTAETSEDQDGQGAGPARPTVRVGMETSERQRALWRMIITGRYLVIITVVAVALVVPSVPAEQKQLALVLGLVALPYNAVFDVLMRRRGTLSLVLAFSDQVLAVAMLAYAPELLAPLLLFMLAISANTAVSFGRRQ